MQCGVADLANFLQGPFMPSDLNTCMHGAFMPFMAFTPTVLHYKTCYTTIEAVSYTLYTVERSQRNVSV